MAPGKDLEVASGDIRNFIAEAQHALQCSRVRTNFGKQTSRHWYYVALSNDSELVPTIVTLEVRRSKGIDSVYLTEVRGPTTDELADMGLAARVESPFPRREARQAVLEALEHAKSSLSISSEELQRGILAYDGAYLAGAYQLGPWTISGAMNSASSSLASEKILLCDRVVRGRDVHDMILRREHQLSQLSILLTVFWLRHIYQIRSEHRWTIEPHTEDGQLKLKNKLAQLGYAPEPLSELDPSVHPPISGQTVPIDRLDTWQWATVSTEPLKPPEDAALLYDLFEKADIAIARRFLEAAKAYNTAHVIWPATPTGAIAYLVVAAESLVEEDLPVCSSCNQRRGILEATRKLFFRELPCLLEDERRAKALLNRVYKIRSQHFHDARFLAGELEEWHTSDILMPDAIEHRETYGRFMALVNGLLVAWLVRRVTAERWPRAASGFPNWREGKHFAVSVQLGAGKEA